MALPPVSNDDEEGGEEREKAHGMGGATQVIMDRDTGLSKGFGFVEMKTEQEAQAAIAALNGAESRAAR